MFITFLFAFVSFFCSNSAINVLSPPLTSFFFSVNTQPASPTLPSTILLLSSTPPTSCPLTTSEHRLTLGTLSGDPSSVHLAQPFDLHLELECTTPFTLSWSLAAFSDLQLVSFRLDA
eukprot:GABV01011842.1.p2 GENE.GABV01011842.1~~GABV01011842.1.p2  ORF type:complete len:118 (-),score=23.03 GABV01011842.1:3-356(-)